MKRASLTDEQIVRILQEAVRSPVMEVAKCFGVSEPSEYAWRKKFGDMGTDDVLRLKALEQENARLRKMCAEERLKAEILNEALTKKW
jgi:putative transposase